MSVREEHSFDPSHLKMDCVKNPLVNVMKKKVMVCCKKCRSFGDCGHTIKDHPELACECHKDKGEVKHDDGCCRGTLKDCKCPCHNKEEVENFSVGGLATVVSDLDWEAPAIPWEERFLRLFKECGLHLGYSNKEKADKLKSFIRSEIEEAEKRGMLTPNKALRMHENGIRQSRQEVLEILERELPEAEQQPSHAGYSRVEASVYSHSMGFNKCRTAVLTLITKLKGEL